MDSDGLQENGIHNPMFIPVPFTALVCLNATRNKTIASDSDSFGRNRDNTLRDDDR